MCHPLVSVNSPHVLWSQFKRKQTAFIQKALQPVDGFLYREQLDQAPAWGCHSVRVFVRPAPRAATAKHWQGSTKPQALIHYDFSYLSRKEAIKSIIRIFPSGF